MVQRKTIHLDSFEEDVVIESLNRARTEQIDNDMSDEDISRLMLKILRTPVRKARRRDEAR